MASCSFRTLMIRRPIHPRWSIDTAHRLLWVPCLPFAEHKGRVCTLISRSRDWVFEAVEKLPPRPTWRTLDSYDSLSFVSHSLFCSHLVWALSKHQKLFAKLLSISLFLGPQARMQIGRHGHGHYLFTDADIYSWMMYVRNLSLPSCNPLGDHPHG